MIRRSFSHRRRFRAAAYVLLMTLFSFVMLYPLLWMFFSSFKPAGDILVTANELFPRTWTLEHYQTGWQGFAHLSFEVFFQNSLYIAIASTIGTVLSSAFVAFGFARIRFAGRKLWFTLMILTMMLPGQILMIPSFVIFKVIGWVSTYKPLIIPAYFGSAFFIFLVMQFMRSIPTAMEESATVDGCGWLGIFFYIMLPMIVPALATVGVLSFIGSWDDYMGALLYLNKPSMYPVSFALKLFSDETTFDYGATFAMSVLSLIPILILFVAFQKNLVEGISFQGLKG